MSRPSHKELNGKIEHAKHCLKNSKIHFENIKQFVKDAMELEISFTSSALLEVFNEVKPEHYIGKKPPDKSYETKIVGCDLFSFKLFSSYLNEDIYIKFAFNKNELWISSLHKDRPENRGG